MAVNFLLFSSKLEAVFSIGLMLTILSSLLGGTGPGLLTSIITSLGIDYFFVEPLHSTFNDVSDFFHFGLFLFCSFVSSYLVGATRQFILRLEEARRQEELAKNERQHVLNVVAHDLRNPLAAITLNAEMINRKVPTDPQAAISLAQQIKNSAGRMNRIIQDLLDAAKINTSHFKIVEAPTGIDQLFTEMRIEAQEPAEKANVSLKMVDETNGKIFHCDQEQLLRALSNLISNAIKFSPPQSQVLVTAADKSSTIEITISDQGSGIGPKDLPRIFERHWQAPDTAHRGTGLGLYIAKGIVEGHGGKIWVHKSSSDGTEFKVALPYSSP